MPPWRFAAFAAAGVGLAITVAIIHSEPRGRKRAKNNEHEKHQNEANDSENDKSKSRDYANNNDSNHTHTDALPSHLQRELFKERRRQEKIPELARKSPMYDNVEMLDPQGTLLASISAKKARWYVGKKLAEWIVPDTRVQLVFTPKNHSGGFYEKARKQNICVACGSSDFFMRHYIVPYAYRSLLPIQYKTHLSHDVVILCPDCHLHCEQWTQVRMKELEESRPAKHRNATFVNRDLHRVKSAALALLRWRNKLPPGKIQEYDTLVRTHLKFPREEYEDELSYQQLQQAISVECRTDNPDYIAGPEWVFRSLDNNDDKITKFIKDWRRHFIETVQPKHLPSGWSIDSPVTSNVDGEDTLSDEGDD